MGNRISSHVAEVIEQVNSTARVGQRVVEVLRTVPARNPTTITGAGVSQRVVEVLFCKPTDVRVGQHVVETLTSLSDIAGEGGGGPGAGGGAHGFAYIS
jgi:hypothetical protein